MTLDPATLLGAVNVLNDEIGGNATWQFADNKNGPRQKRLADYWQFSQGYQPTTLDLLSIMVSGDYTELNAFVIEKGFTANFRPIAPDGIGVATVLDLLMEWTAEAEVTELYRKTDTTWYPAFTLPVTGVQIMNVEGISKPVVRIPTKQGPWAWLVMTEQPADELAMLDLATSLLLDAKTTTNTEYAGARIPKVDIDQQVDLGWLLGLSLGDHVIDQAFQQVKLRMNEAGARVKAATGLASTRSPGSGPRPLVFDQPFLGFFTRGADSPLPFGIFYADTDSWREPQGSLEEM